MNKLASMLSLTKKAGKLISGFDVAKDSVEKKNAGWYCLQKICPPSPGKRLRWFVKGPAPR